MVNKTLRQREVNLEKNRSLVKVTAELSSEVHLIGRGTLKKGDKIVSCQRCGGTGIKPS
jgi:hypothetical protein